MAKRKVAAKRRTSSKRRRSVGAVNKTMLMQAAGTIAGYVAGNMLQSKIAPTMDAKIKGAATAAIGIVVLPMLIKSDMGKAVGIGLATSGAVELLKGFNVISGVGAYNVRQLPAPGAQRLIAGSGINQMVGGSGINRMVGGSGINRMVGAKRSSAMQNALKYG